MREVPIISVSQPISSNSERVPAATCRLCHTASIAQWGKACLVSDAYRISPAIWAWSFADVPLLPSVPSNCMHVASHADVRQVLFPASLPNQLIIGNTDTPSSLCTSSCTTALLFITPLLSTTLPSSQVFLFP